MHHDEFIEQIRQDARERHAKLVADGKCAERPGDLLGPSCEYDAGHEGLHSWAPFFEPDGSFHATDPNGVFPAASPFWQGPGRGIR